MFSSLPLLCFSFINSPDTQSNLSLSPLICHAHFFLYSAIWTVQQCCFVPVSSDRGGLISAFWMGVQQGEHVEPKIAIFLQSRACFCAKLRFWHNGGGGKQASKKVLFGYLDGKSKIPTLYYWIISQNYQTGPLTNSLDFAAFHCAFFYLCVDSGTH